MMRLTGWKSDVAALLAGALLPLSFAPFGWWPLAIVCLYLFWQIALMDSRCRALWRSLLFGLGYFGIGVSWVYVSISLFGNATPMLASVITFLLVLVLSGYIVLMVYLVRLLTDYGYSSLLVIPAVWVVIEWLRGWLFTGFGWLDIGYAFIDTPLAAYGPFVGVLGIGYLVLLSVTSLNLIVRRIMKPGLHLLTGLLLAVVWIIPLLLNFSVPVKPQGHSLNVALLQGNIPQHLKWIKSERESTLKLYRQMTERHWDKQLIIWPETAIPAFEDQVSGYLETLHTAARLSETALMVGLPVRETHGSRYYNALAVLGGSDRGADTLYKKSHLVPFGEYLPLKFMLGPLLDYLEIPMSNFSAGDADKPLVTVGQYQAGAFICFEIAFAEQVRAAMPEADYLVNISNDAWFGNSLAPHQHLQMARMRALENGRYLLRVTNTGITAIIEPDGRIQSNTAQFEQQILTGSIRAQKGSTFYSRYGDYPLLGFVFALLVAMLLYRYKQG